MLVEGYFRDIGTIDAYQRAQQEWPVAGRDMIITQTPLRIGLLGGGTDLPDYYREHGGRVLNCAIDKYIYVIVKQRFDDDIYVNYSKKEIVSRVEDLEHELVREAMQMAGVTNGVEITTLADIPSGGLGPRLVVRGHRRPAACAVRVPGTAGVGGGARRAGLHHRDRPLREAHRQAGPVHRGVRRASATCASGRATRWSPRNWGFRRRHAGRSSSRSCCSTPASRGARTRSWPSRRANIEVHPSPARPAARPGGLCRRAAAPGRRGRHRPRDAGELGGQAEACVRRFK